jgi:hypothetical protein
MTTMTYNEAMSAADRMYAPEIRALFRAGFPQAHVQQTGGMSLVIEIPLSDRPDASYPYLWITGAEGGSLPWDRSADPVDGWMVGLYLDEADDGTTATTDDSSADALVALVRRAAEARL